MVGTCDEKEVVHIRCQRYGADTADHVDSPGQGILETVNEEGRPQIMGRGKEEESKVGWRLRFYLMAKVFDSWRSVHVYEV